MASVADARLKALDVASEPPDWAATPCRQTDPELWYPEKGHSSRTAKSLCLGCEVRVQCLELALERGEGFGVWGGLTVRERRALVRKREAAAAKAEAHRLTEFVAAAEGGAVAAEVAA